MHLNILACPAQTCYHFGKKHRFDFTRQGPGGRTIGASDGNSAIAVSKVVMWQLRANRAPSARQRSFPRRAHHQAWRSRRSAGVTAPPPTNSVQDRRHGCTRCHSQDSAAALHSSHTHNMRARGRRKARLETGPHRWYARVPHCVGGPTRIAMHGQMQPWPLKNRRSTPKDLARTMQISLSSVLFIALAIRGIP